MRGTRPSRSREWVRLMRFPEFRWLPTIALLALGLLAVELDRRGVACGHRGEQSGWAGGDGDEEEGLGEVLLWGEQR